MILQKEIQTYIKSPAFLFVTKIDLDANYFIKRIQQGVKGKDNKNYETNVKSQMTSWNYFKEDKVFHEQICLPSMDIVQSKIRTNESAFTLELQNAWGIKQEKNEKTIKHNHIKCYFSGAVYLNDCDQPLYFDEIQQEINPEKGLLVLFSGNLQHYTTRNKSNTKYSLAFNYAQY